jgi:putative membrane protein
MNGLAQAVALISAVVYIAAAPLELFFFGNPRVRAFLHVEADNVADVRVCAFCIGFRNPSARSSDWSFLWTGDEAVGRAVVLTAPCYMLLASLGVGIADLLRFCRPRGGSVLGTLGSSLPPLVALATVPLSVAQLTARDAVPLTCGVLPSPRYGWLDQTGKLTE